MPAPRNVSMDCPFRKKAAKTLQRETFEAIMTMNDEGSTKRREGGAGAAPYGFVKMMSDAPRVQRIVCERRYIRAGRIPHVRGSSSLEDNHIQAHYTRRALGPGRGDVSKKWRTSRDGYRLEMPHVRNDFSRGSRSKI